MSLYLTPGQTLVIATHNEGKAREFDSLLGALFTIKSAAEVHLPEPEETETSFVGNAILKARHAARLSGMVAIGDDSGLCIDVLGGDPGIYSARWAGPNRDFQYAMAQIEQKMEQAKSANPDHFSPKAHFVSALSIAWPQGHACVFEGKWLGSISFPARGHNGFGYDPIFQPDGYEITAAEMSPELKDSLSHRTRAFAALKAALLASN